MVLIWRGIGIIVPIAFFLFAFILSYWFEDTHFGNKGYTGWISFYTAILCLLAGLVALGGTNENDNQGRRINPLWRHHFFYLPVIFWAVIFGVVSGYCLLSSGSDLAAIGTSNSSDDESDTISKVHFYNPTPDTLFYVMSDETGYFEKEKLEPYTSIVRDAPSESYLLAGLNFENEYSLVLPGRKNYDERKYIGIKEGEDTIQQRKIPRRSKQVGDYEDSWLMLSNSFDMAVLDISELADMKGNGFMLKERVAKIDWMKKIHSKHLGDELMELRIKPAFKGQQVVVVNPNTLLPSSRDKNEALYVLVVYSFDKELNNEFFVKQIERLFPE